MTEETLQGIAALMLDEYKPGMEAKGIAYSYTPAALKALVQKSQGGRFGARDLRRTIRKAVEDAELMAGCEIHSVYVGIAGSHIMGINSHGVIAVKGGEVAQRDVERALDAARLRQVLNEIV